MVGSAIMGSVTYSTYSIRTGMNDALIDNFYLNEATAKHALLTDQLTDPVTLKKVVRLKFFHVI